jgi:hypothetical protein
MSSSRAVAPVILTSLRESSRLPSLADLSLNTPTTGRRPQTKLPLHLVHPFHERLQLLIDVLKVQDDLIQHVVFVVRASEAF